MFCPSFCCGWSCTANTAATVSNGFAQKVVSQEISSEVHRLSYQLHPSKLDHLGLAAAVKSLCCELAEYHKVQIDFRHRGLPAVLAKEVTLCLFRIVQESLNNVIKHSGSREAKVVLEGTGKAVLLRVTDDGCGFDESAQMRGLGFWSFF